MPWLFALAAGVPAVACAWQSTPPRPVSPPPVVVVQPPANARFQQTLREQQVSDQLRKNQLEEQLRQNQAATIRRPYATDTLQAVRLQQQDQAQRELYRARQQDLLDRYQSAVAPPVVHSSDAPASTGSTRGSP
ncbi:hypothetical protein [Fulvimonas yonginensis]|uniref:Uncharacterized protein n=1 Tax=Fulvimonas yonginensis TaxID=1495200 RepID=A0ABU8JCZ5_9GAMM